jgi:toxin-antitoxin system PIN domain toxin
VSGAALLDVNVLVALADPDHVHHEIAHDWFADHAARPWATCAVTEAGFVRVISNPAYGAAATSTADLILLLRNFCAGASYEFWPEAVSLRDASLFRPSFIRGHRQLTDIYLLGLVTSRGGRLVTFDGTIPINAVIGATPAQVEVIAAAAI